MNEDAPPTSRTVTGDDDGSEESDSGSDRSTIFDGLLAKLLGNTEQGISIIKASRHVCPEMGRGGTTRKGARAAQKSSDDDKKAKTAGLRPETDGRGAGCCLDQERFVCGPHQGTSVPNPSRPESQQRQHRIPFPKMGEAMLWSARAHVEDGVVLLVSCRAIPQHHKRTNEHFPGIQNEPAA